MRQNTIKAKNHEYQSGAACFQLVFKQSFAVMKEENQESLLEQLVFGIRLQALHT